MKHEEEWCAGSQIAGNIQNEGSRFAVDHSGIDREASRGFRRSGNGRGKETCCREYREGGGAGHTKPAAYRRRVHRIPVKAIFQGIITQELSTRQSAGFVEL